MNKTLAPIVAVSLALCAPAAAADKPIIAVFPLQAKGVALAPDTLDRLGDYLAGQLAAAGRFQVVPRSQVKARLSQEKRQSYKGCYDQSCQIEIGKELAAQKSLAVQVIKIGSRCAVTATIYDLRRAAAERGATAKAGCSEDQIVSALDSVIGDLARHRPPPVPPMVATPPPAKPAAVARVNVDLSSEPSGARVRLDGRSVGTTPLRLNVIKGQRYAIELDKRGYLARTDWIEARGYSTQVYRLEAKAERRYRERTRTEWLALEALLGSQLGGSTVTRDDGGAGGGIVLSLITLKWRWLAWTTLEVGGGAGGDVPFAQLGTRLSLQLAFGDRGAHQLRLGATLGGGINDEPGFIVSPTLHYLYQTSKRAFYGIGGRAYLPAFGGREGDTAAVMFSMVLGWASLL